MNKELEELAKEAEALGRLDAVRLYTLEDVDAWATANGGELVVRSALAEEAISHPVSVRVARAWLALLEHQRREFRAQDDQAAQRRSVVAAERAARYAMWSAAISAATGIVSAFAYYVTR